MRNAGLAGGTLTCALAPTLTAVVIGRVLAAVGSGAIIAVALTGTALLAPDRRPAAMATFGACLAGFSATAPLAGAAASHWSWRAALVLPVISIAAIPLCWSLTARRPHPDRVDWLAASLLGAAAAGLLLTAQAATHSTSVFTTVVTAAATAAALGALVACTRDHPNGFVVVEVLACAWFRRAALAGGCVYAGLFAVLYAAPLLLSQQDYRATHIGVLLLPGAVLAALITRAAGQAARRLPARYVLAAVSMLFAVTLSCAAVSPRPSVIVAATTAAFTASAVAQMLLNATTTSRTDTSSQGGAIGLLTLAIFLGGGCGAALCATLWHSCGPEAALTLMATLPAAGAVAACALEPENNRI